MCPLNGSQSRREAQICRKRGNQDVRYQEFDGITPDCGTEWISQGLFFFCLFSARRGLFFSAIRKRLVQCRSGSRNKGRSDFPLIFAGSVKAPEEHARMTEKESAADKEKERRTTMTDKRTITQRQTMMRLPIFSRPGKSEAK